MGFLGFLTKKKFYISLGLAVIITLVLVLVSFRFIKSYTRHGEALVLPDFSGMTLEELKEYQYDDVFDFIVTDSVFANELRPGSVIMQNPSAHSKVKRGRNIYITVVAMNPEKTIMPDLRDLTVRQAFTRLKNQGLTIGKLVYISDMADNAVLGHYFNQDTIRTGDELLSGSEIDLLIGQFNTIPGPVPFLIGKDERAAIDMIFISSFNKGKIRYWDSLAMQDGKVYRQSPGWTEMAKRGENIDIWLRSPSQINFDSLVETLMPDTVLIEEHVPDIPEESIIFEE